MAWPVRLLRILVPITGIVLVVQYFLGMWINIYGPAGGFTTNTSFPALNGHYDVGYLLGILTIVGIAVAAFARQRQFVVFSVLLFVGVFLAGFFGGDFVRTTPNDPVYSLAMALSFLFVFAIAVVYALFLRSPNPASWFSMVTSSPQDGQT